jgi:hypothetical protein
MGMVKLTLSPSSPHYLLSYPIIMFSRVLLLAFTVAGVSAQTFYDGSGIVPHLCKELFLIPVSQCPTHCPPRLARVVARAQASSLAGRRATPRFAAAPMQPCTTISSSRMSLTTSP